jgi:DNA-binding transcriptional LysR family regulator
MFANGYYASPAYVAKYGLAVEPADLRAHRCIGYSFQASTDAWDTDRWTVYRGTAVRSVAVQLAITTNSGLVMRELAIEGHGIAVLPERRAAEAVAAGSLVRVLSGYHPETLTLSAVYPIELASSRKIDRLISEVARAFSDS